MGCIALLDDSVINQIAAGEVVERPASVVKELVENSIDAGATRVDIEVQGGGKTGIVVRDDGRGMSESDMHLAIQRHATSKLVGFADLYTLDTLGFRGEALPSIAAVSSLTVTSRRPNTETGYRISICGGEVVEQGEVGAPVGTQIEVRDLLAAVPARLKFLKSDSSEAAQITDVVTKLALAHTGVGFDLKNNGRQVLRTKKGEPHASRVALLLGKKSPVIFHEVEHIEQGVSVRAFLAAPEQARTTSRATFLFIGKRPIRDRGLLHAMSSGFGELLPKGRYPMGAVYLSVPNGRVDVNVHPQKSEVRFSDPQSVYAAVRHAVARGVREAPWLSAALDSSAVTLNPVSSFAARYARERQLSWSTGNSRPFDNPRSDSEKKEQTLDWSNVVSLGDTASVEPPKPSTPASVAHSEPQRDPSHAGFVCFSDLRYLGQIDKTYLLCEAEGEIVLVDQHAAHERVVFERLKAKETGNVKTQAVLFPLTIDVEPALAAALAENVDTVSASGFEIEPFGENAGSVTLAIKATPAGLRESAEEVVRQLLEELSEKGGSRAAEAIRLRVLATVACHSSVRAGDSLSEDEVYALFRDMDETDARTHCPHGRPTTLRVSLREVERRFGRP